MMARSSGSSRITGAAAPAQALDDAGAWPTSEAIAAADRGGGRAQARRSRSCASSRAGIHPAILTEAGLGPAIAALAERSRGPDGRRCPARSAALDGRRGDGVLRRLRGARQRGQVRVGDPGERRAECRGSILHLEVGDNGVGGADAARGSGIRGLEDRVAALGGRIAIESPAGQGTLVVAEIPLD